MMFVTIDAAGGEPRASELEELLRGEMERDRVRVERVDHDRVPRPLVLREEAPTVLDVDLEARVARELEEAVGDVDDVGIDLDHVDRTAGKSRHIRFGAEPPPRPTKRMFCACGL